MFVAVYITTAVLSACGHSHRTNTSVSSEAPTLLGTWKAPGKIPLVNQDLNQRWIAMRFDGNGTVHVKYQAGMPVYSGGLSPAYIVALMKPKNEDLPYNVLGNGKLRVTYGNQAVTYTYEISSNKLYITPPAEMGSTSASVYER